MNKKANLPDVSVALEVVLAVIITIGIVLAVVTQFDANIQTMSNSTVPMIVKNVSTQYRQVLPTSYDYIIPFVLLGMIFFSVAAARLIPSSPTYVIVSVLYLIATPFLAHFVIGNIWHSFADASAVSASLNSMTYTPFIMNHLIYFSLFYIAIVAIALYTKQGEQT